MAHPQNSFRGLFTKSRVDVGEQQLTSDSTGLVLNNGITISNKLAITANTTAYILSSIAALPGSVDSGKAVALISNSTGVALGINATGTTWKYLLTTAKQPT